MITKGKSLFKQPGSSAKNSGPYHGSGLPAKYGTKQPMPPKKSNLRLPKGVPPLKFN